MKFVISSVAAIGIRKADKKYKSILSNYNYQEDDDYSYIEINTLEELIELNKKVKEVDIGSGGLIIRDNDIVIYDGYIE